MKVVAMYSIKGGVGKTTAAVNLGFEAAQSGARVLLWDLDPQGAATFFFRIKPRVKGGVVGLLSRRGELGAHVKESDVAGLHLVPADFSLRHLDITLGTAQTRRLDEGGASTERLAALLSPLDGTYDVAVLDCAPSISLTSEAVFRAADALLVPTIPTTLSVRTLGQLLHFLGSWSASSADAGGADSAPAILPFISMLDRRKSLHRELVESLEHVRPRFLQSAIPNASAVERMGIRRAPLGEIAPRTNARKAFTDLWSEIATHLWSP